MPSHKETLELRRQSTQRRINAILDKDSGVPYPEVLRKYGITDTKFYWTVKKDLSFFIHLVKGDDRTRLEEILFDDERNRELLNMGEAFIQQQYDRVQEGTQKRFYFGTYKHPENVEALVYYALIYHHSELASKNRSEVIQGIKDLPTNRTHHFHEIGLGGLMHSGLSGVVKRLSPLAVLGVFDRVYQRKTGDVSLFDRTQKYHLEIYGNNKLFR